VARQASLELAVEQDDAAMEAYLEGNEPSVEELRRLIRKGTLCRWPSFRSPAGSAFKNKGVQPILNSVIDYPAVDPLDVPAVYGLRSG
jgi:elongation factor G